MRQSFHLREKVQLLLIDIDRPTCSQCLHGLLFCYSTFNGARSLDSQNFRLTVRTIVIQTRTRTYTHARTDSRTRTRTYTHTHARTRARTDGRTHARTHTHTHTHTRTYALARTHIVYSMFCRAVCGRMNCSAQHSHLVWHRGL